MNKRDMQIAHKRSFLPHVHKIYIVFACINA